MGRAKKGEEIKDSRKKWKSENREKSNWMTNEGETDDDG